MSQVSTAEELGQRALDVGVLDERQLQAARGELSTNSVTLDDFSQHLVRKGLLTNYQLDRLTQGLRTGFYYGDYKVLYCAGSGTFARVYRAEHRITKKLYAVKVLRNSMSVKPDQVEQFRREGELGMMLAHRNIVPIHEVVSQGSTHYIVMDFIEGQNLREFYKARGKLDPIVAASIIEDVAAGLHFAFQKGVSHRDLKMSNVLLSSDGVGMLVDFGLAALEAEDGSGADRAIDYAGLERATGVRRDDSRSDVFFAGCMFYQMLTGRPPLSETRERSQRLAKSRYQNIPPIAEVCPGLPAPLVMVVNKAIEFDPTRRYQSPGDLLADIKVAIRRTKAGAEVDATDRNLESREGYRDDGQQYRIMVVESSVKRQDILRELFKRNGYRVLVTADPQRAAGRFVEDPCAADVVLFCAGSLGRVAVDTFNQFGSEGGLRDLPAVLLLEAGQGTWAALAAPGPRRAVLTMPVTLRALRKAVADAIGARCQ